MTEKQVLNNLVKSNKELREKNNLLLEMLETLIKGITKIEEDVKIEETPELKKYLKSSKGNKYYEKIMNDMKYKVVSNLIEGNKNLFDYEDYTESNKHIIKSKLNILSPLSLRYIKGMKARYKNIGSKTK